MVACNLSMINTAICAGPWVSLWKISCLPGVHLSIGRGQDAPEFVPERCGTLTFDQNRLPQGVWAQHVHDFHHFCHQFSRHWDSMRHVFNMFSSTRWVMKRLQDHQLAQWPLLDDIVGAQWLAFDSSLMLLVDDGRWMARTDLRTIQPLEQAKPVPRVYLERWSLLLSPTCHWVALCNSSCI